MEKSNFGSISLYIDNNTTKTKPINIPGRKPSIWIPNKKMSKCFKCKTDFGMITRKHHCRSCGRIFCRNCTQWNCDKSEYITSTTPPNDMYNYLNDLFYDEKTMKICEECNEENKTITNNKKEVIILLNLPLTISELLFLRNISKMVQNYKLFNTYL